MARVMQQILHDSGSCSVGQKKGMGCVMSVNHTWPTHLVNVSLHLRLNKKKEEKKIPNVI